MNRTAAARKASDYSPREYWSGVADRAGASDSAGYAPVLHPHAPPWFNQLIDDLQFRALRKALAIAAIPSGGRVLDVGCGTGRWLRRFADFGYRPTGVDATQGMLRLARSRQTASPLVAGEAFRLPFADASFDAVSDVTVVQHIPTELQPQALAEMVRVLKPGGALLLFELIRGRDAHIFPRAAQDWIAQAAQHGPTLVTWFGQEFLVFDRAFVRAARMLARGASSQFPPQPPPRPAAHADVPRPSASRQIYWHLRHVTAPLSGWLDAAAQKLLPQSLATHGVFIFRK
jgi:SAM-dependent methyltransferase